MSRDIFGADTTLSPVVYKQQAWQALHVAAGYLRDGNSQKYLDFLDIAIIMLRKG